MAEPVLWHLPHSHFNEKVRWALDHKAVAHRRHALPAGPHMAVALGLTRGRSATLPVLALDGRTIAGSAAILAALEEAYPAPALLPGDAGDRRRALALQAFFDGGLGPAVRHLALFEILRDPPARAAFARTMLPGPLREMPRVRALTGRLNGPLVGLRFGLGGEDGAQRARAQVLAALDRVEAELAAGGGDYLVGDAFTVADITAASLFAPAAFPAEGPVMPAPPPVYAAFVDTLRPRPGMQWVQEMYTRHRQGARRP